jgi:hypothetical protein
MNWMVRNLVVVLFGAATCVLTVAALVYMEAVNGQELFSFTLLRLIPVGAISAGFAGGLGYLMAALALRLRPTGMGALMIVAISAGVVFMAESAEFSMFLYGSDQATQSIPAFGRFLATSTLQTPLRFWSTDDPSSDFAMAAFLSPGASPSAPRVQGLGDSKTGGIASGVQGMMATQDVSQTQTGRRLSQMGSGISTLGSGVKAHGKEWMQIILQTFGFALGGLVIFVHLRQLPHCKDCMLLLSDKGERTRYFSRTKDMQNAVDEVLTRARDKQLQQSIQAHAQRGHDKKATWVEFASTIHLRRCMQCDMHTMDFRATRKNGQSWKTIDVLGFSTSSVDPLHFA